MFAGPKSCRVADKREVSAGATYIRLILQDLDIGEVWQPHPTYKLDVKTTRAWFTKVLTLRKGQYHGGVKASAEVSGERQGFPVLGVFVN